jgi:hypothetical protein
MLYAQGRGSVAGAPAGCFEVTDSTGFANVVCEEGMMVGCPVMDDSWEAKCLEFGGDPEYVVDEYGCEYIDCKFTDMEYKNPWETLDVCPTTEDNENVAAKCEEFGGNVFYIKEYGCEIAICEHRESDRCWDFEEMNPTMISNIESKCHNQGLDVVEDYDARGCIILTCGSADDYCMSIPEEAYTNCRGELVVKKDEQGCVIFAECIEQGDAVVGLAPHEKLEDVPSEDVLAEILAFVEDMKEEFTDAAEETADIAVYYEEENNPDAEIFRRISQMFYDAVDMLEEVEVILEKDPESITVEEMEDVKLKLKYLWKSLLKDVMYLMFSTSEDVSDIADGTLKDCGSDVMCFEMAFRMCKPVTFAPPMEDIIATIQGVEGDMCIMTVIKGENEMTCSIPDYASGISDPEEDIVPYCTGDLGE